MAGDAAAPIALSIVVPVYRSAAILPALVAEIRGALGAERWEIVFVHDHGPDDSWAVIGKLAREDARVRGVNLRQNVGQHNAVMAGLNYARGDIIVMMDDDLQHAPSDIPKLVAAINGGADVCYTHFRTRQHAAWKQLGSRLNDRLATFLLDKPKGLYLSPFKAMRRVIRDEVIKYSGPSVYVDGLILAVTGNIVSVEVDHHDRRSGESGFTLAKSISLLLRMSTITSLKPLRLATLTGFALAGLGALLATTFVIQALVWGGLPVGWPSLVIIVLILGGVQLMALGIIGEYVGRIFLEVRKRPQFVVESTIGESERDDGRA